MAKINPWKVTGYKAGQNVACKVNYAEKDGYAVTIQKDNLPGFIKTANTLKAGDEILGVFVCVHNGRILLSQLFSAPRATAHQLAQTTVNWEEHMDDPDNLDKAYEQQAATSRQRRLGSEEVYQAPQTPADFAQFGGAAVGGPGQDVSQGQAIITPSDYSQYAQSGGSSAAAAQPNPYQSSILDPWSSQAPAAEQNPVQNQNQNTAQSPWSNPQQSQAESAQTDYQQQYGQQPYGQQQAQPYGQQPQQYDAQQYAPPQQQQQQVYAEQQSQGTAQYPPAVIPQDTQPAPYQQQAPQEEQWRAEHTQTPTKRFRLRRAIDLVMPPVDQDSLESLKTFKIADYDMEWLITDLEGGMRTGCIKSTSEQKLSRSAALLYRGRAVGCIYGCKSNPEAKPTEESLSAMLSDLDAPDAVVTLYDLPEDVTLSMSALFLGYSIDRNPDMTAREYCDFIMKWFAENGSTACLAVTVNQTKSTYLVFVHKGKFAGAFFVEEQQFTRDPAAIIATFNQYPDARIEASLLNAETLNSGMRFGYSLSMARQKRTGF